MLTFFFKPEQNVFAGAFDFFTCLLKPLQELLVYSIKQHIRWCAFFFLVASSEFKKGGKKLNKFYIQGSLPPTTEKWQYVVEV